MEKKTLVGLELHPSFDVSSPLSCYTQSREILLIKGMKYWDSWLNEPSLRTFVATIHIITILIGWKHSRKESTWQTKFSTKSTVKPSIMPCWRLMYFFFLFFEIASPMGPNKGVPMLSLLDFMDNFTIVKSCRKHGEQASGIQYGICQKIHGFWIWNSNHLIIFIHLLLQLDFGIKWHFNGFVILHANKLKDRSLKYLIWFNFSPLPCLRRNCNLQDLI